MFSKGIDNFLLSNKYPEFKLKAIFFDMDGVLFDSMKDHAIAWVGAMKQMHLPFTELEAYMNEGRTGVSTINEAFKKTYGREATDEEKQKIYSVKTDIFESLGNTSRMPFAYELLQKVKSIGLEIFVVTGSGQASLLNNLELNFPNLFDKEKMVTAFDVKNGKPHPEPYLTALKKSGLKPWEVLVVENAPLGVQSASAAKLYTIAVNTGPLDPNVLKQSGADIVLTGMQELYENWDVLYNECS